MWIHTLILYHSWSEYTKFEHHVNVLDDFTLMGSCKCFCFIVYMCKY